MDQNATQQDGVCQSDQTKQVSHDAEVLPEKVCSQQLLEVLQREFTSYREQFCSLLSEKEETIRALQQQLVNAEQQLAKFHHLEEESAATKIQARMRGMAARQEAHQLRQQQQQLTSAATKIQSRVRGMLTRKHVIEQFQHKEEHPIDPEDFELLRHLLAEKSECLEALQALELQQRALLEQERCDAKEFKSTATRLLQEKDAIIAELERRLLAAPIPAPVPLARISPPRAPTRSSPLHLTAMRASPPRLPPPPPPTPPPLPLSLPYAPERLAHPALTPTDPLSGLDERIARLKSEVAQVRHTRQHLLDLATADRPAQVATSYHLPPWREQMQEPTQPPITVGQSGPGGAYPGADPLRPPRLRTEPLAESTPLQHVAVPSVVTYLPQKPVQSIGSAATRDAHDRPSHLVPSPLRDRPPPPAYAGLQPPSLAMRSAVLGSPPGSPLDTPAPPSAPRRSSPPRSRSPRATLHSTAETYYSRTHRYE